MDAYVGAGGGSISDFIWDIRGSVTCASVSFSQSVLAHLSLWLGRRTEVGLICQANGVKMCREDSTNFTTCLEFNELVTALERAFQIRPSMTGNPGT